MEDWRYKLVDEFGKFLEHRTVFSGFKYDGASIPRFFWRVIGGPFRPEYMLPALEHDELCKKKPRTSAIAAMHFYQRLLANGVGQKTAWTMYKAVLWMGPKW
jgi:hypothetical protein